MQQRSEPSTAPTGSAPLASRPGYRWAVVGMLWFICFFNYADRQAISAILPSLEIEFGFTKTQQGLIASAFMWVYAVSAPLAGRIGDRVSRKMLILGGLYVWSIVTGFTAACTKLWQFVFVRGAEGLGETFYFPASMSMVSDYHAPRTRSRAMGLHQTSVYAGTVGGSWFAGWMAQYYDWRYSFVALGAGGVTLGLVLAVFIREPARNEAERRERGELGDDVVRAGAAASSPDSARRTWRDFVVVPFLEIFAFLWELVRIPSALLLIMAFCGANFVAFVFITWLPSFLRDKYHLDLAQAGFSATVYMQSASMLGAIAGGFLADRWGKLRRGGRSLVQALGALCGAPFIVWCGNAEQLSTIIVAMTCFGFAKGIYDSNIWASLYDVVPAEKRGTAVGLTNMIGWLGGGLGATAFGVVVDHGITMSQAISSTVVIYLGVAGMLVLSAHLAPRAVPMSGPASV
jgi:MFS family permease